MMHDMNATSNNAIVEEHTLLSMLSYFISFCRDHSLHHPKQPFFDSLPYDDIATISVFKGTDDGETSKLKAAVLFRI